MRNAIASRVTLALLLVAFAAAPASAADKIKLGYISTLSGTNAAIGTHGRDGLRLAIDEAGGKLGGLPVELTIEDDQQKPDVARQAAEKMIQSQKVDVIVGPSVSVAILGAYDRIIESKTVMIGPSGGPSPIAGPKCSEFFFSTSFQGDTYAEGMGQVLNKNGVKRLYALAPNYVSGKDVINGLKRNYTGQLVDEVYTPLSQLDFSSEIANIASANPEAVFAFYPAGLAVQFVRQFVQAGLKDKIPLYMSYSIDGISLPALGDSALGVTLTDVWSASLDNPANKAFVDAFTRKYGYGPSYYAAFAYDAGRLLNAAVAKVGGKIEDKGAFLAAIRSAEFKSVRGPFRFNTNQFPIQNVLSGRVERGADGKPSIELKDVVIADYKDFYAGQCPLK